MRLRDPLALRVQRNLAAQRADRFDLLARALASPAEPIGSVPLPHVDRGRQSTTVTESVAVISRAGFDGLHNHLASSPRRLVIEATYKL